MNKTLVILGPTAIGKSQLASEIAQKIPAELISADSMQVYCGMDIGTAKPSQKEQQSIPHHLIDIRDPDEEWTVSDFVKEANRISGDLVIQGKKPIIVGGTGLYLWTLLEGYSFPVAAADKELRQRLEKENLGSLYTKLKEIDPKAANKIHANDKKRIVRALEVYELTGKPISELQEKRARPPSLVPRPTLIGLTMPREQLYQRIEQRVDQMIKKGLVKEVEGLLAKGFSKDLPSFQALGYKEVIEHLAGTWDKPAMIKELKKRTRNFARRQLTWFRRFKDVKWFNAPIDTQVVLDYISSI